MDPPSCSPSCAPPAIGGIREPPPLYGHRHTEAAPPQGVGQYHPPAIAGGYVAQPQLYAQPPVPYDAQGHAAVGGYRQHAPYPLHAPSQGVPIYPQQYVVPPPPATMIGASYPPPSLPQMVLEVVYLPADGCCSCTCLGSGQPDRRPELEVVVDKKEMGRIEQGQTSSFFLSPGPHHVTAKHTGITGFFRSVFGSNEGCTGSIAIHGTGGDTVRVCIGWRATHCCSSKYQPYMERCAA